MIYTDRSGSWGCQFLPCQHWVLFCNLLGSSFDRSRSDDYFSFYYFMIFCIKCLFNIYTFLNWLSGFFSVGVYNTCKVSMEDLIFYMSSSFDFVHIDWPVCGKVFLSNSSQFKSIHVQDIKVTPPAPHTFGGYRHLYQEPLSVLLLKYSLNIQSVLFSEGMLSGRQYIFVYLLPMIFIRWLQSTTKLVLVMCMSCCLPHTVLFKWNNGWISCYSKCSVRTQVWGGNFSC